MISKLLKAAALALITSNASAVSLFSGSLYMLDSNGNPALENTQCTSCNSLAGEIDNNLTTLVDISAGTTNDITGSNPLFDTGLDWSITNLSFVINPDNTISATGTFLWTNYAGLTSSSFMQVSQLLGPNGEIVAIDGDSDLIKGNKLLDGPFQGYSIYLEGTLSTVPVPAAAWLFGSGLIGLIGFSRRKKYEI